MKKRLINLEPVKEQVREKLLEKYNSTIFMNTDTVDVKVDIKEILEKYINEKNLTEPTIYITTEAYIKMRKLVDDTTTEIGWYGTVTKCPGLDNVYVIEDILVYPQKVTGATCEQDDDKMFEFEMSLTTEQVNHKRFQGHSHVNMGVTPSGVDENFYQDLLTQVTDYFIIAVTNKRNEYTVRFYDIENNILYTDLSINVILDDGRELNSWYEEAKNKLKDRVVTVNTVASKTKSKYYTAKEQLELFNKHRVSPYDFEEDDDDDDAMIWDEDLGYVTRGQQKFYKGEVEKEKNSPSKRPNKRDKRGRR